MAVSSSSDKLSGLIAVSKQPDIRLFYTLSSPISPTKPIIVTSNSLAAATPLWDDFAAAFAPTHTIIRYDARFHGQSPLSTSPGFDYQKGHTIEDLAEDVVKLLDALGVQIPVTYVGLSIGAGVGVILGAKYPERFERLVIVGTKAQAAPGDDQAFDARIEFLRIEGPRSQAQQSVQRWFGESWIASNPDKAKFVEEIVSKQSFEGFIASVAALRRLNLWSYADDIKKRGDGGRLLFVVGEWDTAVVEDTKALAERAGSEVVVVEGAGHIVNVQQPERFHDLVWTYIGRQSRI